jgi:hypothetical protein
MPAVTKDRWLSVEEVEARIQAVTAADCIRLERMARVYSEGTDWSPADLLQEAFVAALSRRQWRADLDLTVFLVGVMRSLASSKRKSIKRDPLAHTADAAEPEEEELAHVGDDPERDPGAIAAADEEAERALRGLTDWFGADSEVQTVLRGRARGDGAAEIRAALRMNQTQYESVCRRMLRGYVAYKKAQE